LGRNTLTRDTFAQHLLKHYFNLGSTDNFVKVIPLIDSLWREFSNKTPWPLFR